MLFSGYFHVHLKLKKLMTQPPGKKSINNQEVRNVNKFGRNWSRKLKIGI